MNHMATFAHMYTKILRTLVANSAWTEVWTGAWPTRASFLAPRGRDLDTSWVSKQSFNKSK